MTTPYQQNDLSSGKRLILFHPLSIPNNFQLEIEMKYSSGMIKKADEGKRATMATIKQTVDLHPDEANITLTMQMIYRSAQMKFNLEND